MINGKKCGLFGRTLYLRLLRRFHVGKIEQILEWCCVSAAGMCRRPRLSNTSHCAVRLLDGMGDRGGSTVVCPVSLASWLILSIRVMFAVGTQDNVSGIINKHVFQPSIHYLYNFFP